MSITGVISGTSDAAVLKTAKVTISTVVPVVGGILSDASESALVGIGVLKNAAGIYGILAVLAVCINPLLKAGVQYLLLKCTSMVCSVFGNKNISALLDAFSTVMGLLLAMVASAAMLVLFSTVCYLKGIG
jgi:stage III sporulation protein AE